MPEGLRNIGAVALRYSGQANAYLFLLTDRYPYSAPAVRDRERDEQLVLPIDEPAATGRRAELTESSRPEPHRPRHRRRLPRWPSGSCAPRCSSARRSRPACTSRSVDADAVFGKALVREAGARRAVLPRHLGARADRAVRDALDLRPPRAAVRPGVGRRADRHRDAARHARARDRLARPAAVHAARRLVGATVRPDRGGLPRVGARPLVRARRRVRRRSASRCSS